MDPATAAHITNLLHCLSVGTNVQAPVAAGFFECPSCHTIHPLTVAHTPAATAVPTAAAAAAPAAAAAVPNVVVVAVPHPAPEHPPAGSNPNGPWYAVVTGRQVGLFQDCYGWWNDSWLLVDNLTEMLVDKFTNI
ncbi:hypothetical protein BDN71DRAFT_1426578 [Pleurotus eryngii]|uniref:Uncharacterized protein n=1 Tax=Pleurotus eryngii TaxID=5323 RepID=A0A9P6A7N1_PLEER|nr:hypothetical protein BDN71DRAFT_1426578 [Pleurotus eryngii]